MNIIGLGITIIILIHTLSQFSATKNIGVWITNILVGWWMLGILILSINYVVAKVYRKLFKN